MKTALAALVLLSSPLLASTPYEVCTPEGPCAIRAYDSGMESEVWLVTQESVDLQTVWSGYWYVLDDELYTKLSSEIPEESKFSVPAVNPTTDAVMRKGSGRPTPPPTPKSPPGSGPLIQVGDVTIGGGNTCEPCHGSNLKEIHSKNSKKDKL